jgi:hypothetical protein
MREWVALEGEKLSFTVVPSATFIGVSVNSKSRLSLEKLKVRILPGR